MGKPTIFFSHSSRDKKELSKLKDLFVKKTGKTIDVFLSSDGQSIPLGRNWVHRIEEALGNAKIMIIFVTPNSLRSNWIFFESGFAYSKKIRVVPVGFLGVDLNDIPPPLNLLQGFNINSEEGLNNLIAIVNDEFDYSHSASFTNDEYRDICMSSGAMSSKIFGEYGALIDNSTFSIELKKDEFLNVKPEEVMGYIANSLKDEGVEYTRSENTIICHGISFLFYDNNPNPLVISIDPMLADITFPIAEKALSKNRSNGINGIAVTLEFKKSVDCILDQHKITGRIYGLDIKLADNDNLVYKNIQFYIEHSNYDTEEEKKQGNPFLVMHFQCDKLPTQEISELLQILFERKLLFIGSEPY